MKRVLAFLIAAVMMASLSVVALADSTHQTSSDGRVDKQSSREVQQIGVETPVSSGEILRVDDNRDDQDLLEKLVDNTAGSQKLSANQKAPYVFNVGVYNTSNNNMANGKYPTVTLNNISIPQGYTFDYVLYFDGAAWVRGSADSGIVGEMPAASTLTLTNYLPDTIWNINNGPVDYPDYKGIPIAVVVSTTGSGTAPDASVTPLSPQTGEPTVAAWLLGAAVMAAVCAAFAVKGRKAD